MVLRVARHQRRLRFRTVASSDKRPSPVSVRNERLYFSVLVNSRLEFLHDFDHRFIVRVGYIVTPCYRKFIEIDALNFSWITHPHFFTACMLETLSAI